MARPSSPRPYDNDCLRLPATSSPRIRGAEKKESTDLRLNQPCPPYVTPSSISSFVRHLSSAHIAESKSLKNRGANTFCQSSARPCAHKPRGVMRRLRLRCPNSDQVRAARQEVAMGQKATFIQINSGMRLQNQEFDNLSAVCHEHEIDQLNGML